jgi:sec-independent protein translocase protein TatB
MFEFSLSELLLIGVVILIFIKPEDLPAMLRSFGKIVGKVRAYSNEITALFDEKKINDNITKVLGDDGKMHIAYDVNELENLIKNREKVAKPNEEK